jgi:serine/threonine protein kinase
MGDDGRADGVAGAIEDYHRRRALGEAVEPEAYRRTLGDRHEEFLAILRQSRRIDEASSAPASEALPRTFGPYTLLRELGRGAAGVVYEAVHRDLGRRAALKVLRTGFDSEPTALERFRREARACSQIRHDHVVEIYEMGEAEGRPYYAMELVPGIPLSDAIGAGSVPAPRALFAAVAGIADALDALHRAGVVHRDVKPSNVMVRPDGRMVLADFGLARTAAAAGLTQTGEALGTPLYMSPEQVLGQRTEIDARTDVYGLGATLYEALTGRPPFQADDLAALLRLILTQRPTSPRVVSPAVPEEAERVVLKAMEKRREDRYASAAALRDDLRAFAEGRPVEGRPVPVLTRFFRALRRRALPIGVGVLLVAVGAFLWSRRSGSLRLESVPPGVQVLLDGAVLGRTPLATDLSSGSYRLVFRRDGFEEGARSVTLAAGERYTLEVALVLADERDEAGETALAEGVGIAAPAKTPERTAGVRGTGDDPIAEAVYPRGDVRLEDLDVAVLDLDGPRAPAAGRVEFRRGETLLASVPVAIEWTWQEVAIPEAVRSAVRPKDVVTWRFFEQPASASTSFRTSPLAEATFRVADRDPASEWAAKRKRLGPQPPRVLESLRHRWLLTEGYGTAVLRASLTAARADPKDRRAWTTAARALDAMGLRSSSLADDVREAARGADVPALRRILR